MISLKQRQPPRVKEKKELNSKYDKLPASETIASEALLKMLQSRRMKANKNRDLAGEGQAIAGMMALHTTAWDWLSPTLKNTARDIEPCLKAIAVERQYLGTYRPEVLQDKFIGALRRLVEEALSAGVKKVYKVNPGATLTSERQWVWWDGVALPETHETIEQVLGSIKDTMIVQQRKTQERLLLENQDREAITKLVTYVTNMACAQSSSDANAPVSSDVITPLHDLITVSVSSRPHWLQFTWAGLYVMSHGPHWLQSTWADLYVMSHGPPWLQCTSADLSITPCPAMATTYLCGPWCTTWYALATIDMRGATYIDRFVYLSRLSYLILTTSCYPTGLGGECG